jgi:hypothetical protein
MLILEYSKHSIRERIFDTFGLIEYVPKVFLKSGCKSVIEQSDKSLRIHYIYNNKLDLVLIVAHDNFSGFVLTNWLIRAENTDSSKGRYRISRQ